MRLGKPTPFFPGRERSKTNDTDQRDTIGCQQEANTDRRKGFNKSRFVALFIRNPTGDGARESRQRTHLENGFRGGGGGGGGWG